MTIWKTTPVSKTPELVLDRWAIFEALPGPSYHFVGNNLTEGGEGRVSSDIASFDGETMTGVTRSGRVYNLTNVEGPSMDARYVWNAWKRINAIEEDKRLDLETFCSKISTPRE